MGFFVFPNGYVIPDPPTPVVLTAPQRDHVKTRMQTYITNQDRPVHSTELISLGQQRLLEQYNIIVSGDQLESIAQEILSEWGTAGD